MSVGSQIERNMVTAEVTIIILSCPVRVAIILGDTAFEFSFKNKQTKIQKEWLWGG